MISIIIPTYNRENILQQTILNLYNLFCQYSINFEVIIINDGNDINVYNPGFKDFKLYKNNKKGVASARNLGIKKSNFDNLLFIDDDILLTHNAVKTIINFIEEKLIHSFCLNFIWEYTPEVKKLSLTDNFIRYLMKVYDKSIYKDAHYIFFKDNLYFIEDLSSCALLISKENMLKVGGYNESYPYSGFEDYDFSKRVKEYGIKVLCSKDIIYHNDIDNMSFKRWKEKRQIEGLTRAMYVRITKDSSWVIKHSIVKRLLFAVFIRFNMYIYDLCKLLNNKRFDLITFKLYNVLAGAFIWKGYNDCFKNEQKKKN
ncbi:MAG: glycosyltransferase [Bacteroidales bacterium]|nr:glycosyltransferase [Bacteroidales bacterium]